MLSAVTFIVPGKVVGKQRPKFARMGNFVRAYTPEKTVGYENLVKMEAASVMRGVDPFDIPLRVEIHISIIPPASWSNKKRLAAVSGDVSPTGKPDLDNTAKSILDACNGIVWTDDSRIVSLTVTKRYGVKDEAIVLVGCDSSWRFSGSP